MKTTDNSLLLKPLQKQTTPTMRPASATSARPMKSMVRVKSIRPQRLDLRKRALAPNKA